MLVLIATQSLTAYGAPVVAASYQWGVDGANGLPVRPHFTDSPLDEVGKTCLYRHPVPVPALFITAQQ
jgi:hypothetical protein